MATKTQYPTYVEQTGNSSLATWSSLDNIKNSTVSKYAYVSVNGNKKTGPAGTIKTRAKKVQCTNFKFNIPSNAVVKKIEVHYRHVKLITIGQGTPGVPKPTITLLTLGKSSSGQAPTTEGQNRSVSWTGLWEPSKINATGFGVSIDYGKNTNNNDGMFRLNYVYIKITYFQPSFAVSASPVTTTAVYNKSNYEMKVSLSDSNLTGRSTNVTISAPSGLTFVKASGNGRVVQNQSQSLTWTPAMNANSSSASVILTFETNIQFSSGETYKDRTFNYGIDGYAGTHTIRVYRELPEQTEESADEKEATNDDLIPDYEKVLQVKKGETFHLSPQFSADEIDNAPVWGSGTYAGEHYFIWVLYENPHFSGDLTRKSSWNIMESSIDSDGNITKDYVLNEVGQYTFKIFSGTSSSTGTVIRELDVDIYPLESELTTPYLSLLEPTDEEKDRLGNGYGYTAQSNIKLTSSEDYVRDWYKNFRVGVFNNPVWANVTKYTMFEAGKHDRMGEIIGDDQERDLFFKRDLTGCSLTFEKVQISGAGLSITINGQIIVPESGMLAPVVTGLTGTETTVTLKSYFDANDKKFNIIVKDSDNKVIETQHYWLKYTDEGYKETYEYTQDTTDYDNLTPQQIFHYAEYWSNLRAGLNTYENLECQFVYNKNYPFYILLTGDYPEGAPSDNPIKYTEPCIIETDDYTQRETNGTYPIKIEDTLAEEAFSEITLQGFTQSDKIVFYGYPLEDHYGTNEEMAIRGIELKGTIQQADQLVLYAKLKSPTGESRERSIVISEFDGNQQEFTIGGNGDLWGFSTLDIVEFEDWEAELTISNVLNEGQSSLLFNDVQLALYIETVESQVVECYIEDENISYYGAFITDLKIPEGLETDTAFLSIDGTDTNDAYRQNIKEKTIKLEIDIGNSCDITANTLTLREFAKLLVNDRDEYNRPIPKTIRFSHYPDVYWEYIMEKPFDTKVEVGTYHIKADLTIPAGTSYDINSTTTSNTGYVNGIASINPVIIVKPTEQIVTIKEDLTGQEFRIQNTNWENKILEIDCEDQIAWLKTDENDIDPVNINKYIDFNSDWFRLKGEYSFTGTGCVIMTVDYSERW